MAIVKDKLTEIAASILTVVYFVIGIFILIAFEILNLFRNKESFLMKFKLNDKINWCGLTGKVVKITDKEVYPVYVQLDNANKILQFTKGGEYCAFHKADKLLKNVEAIK